MIIRPAFVELPNPLASIFESNSQYERLLDNVITASRAAIFPAQGPFNMGSLRDPLLAITESESLKSTEYPSAFGVRSENHMEHNKKIGAAGGLFVSTHFTYLNIQKRSIVCVI
jgi:hypothetical protein